MPIGMDLSVIRAATLRWMRLIKELVLGALT